MYMLRNLPNNRQGTTVAMMIIKPPIVGTPLFSTPYGSMFALRWASLIPCLFIHLIKYSPNHTEMINESTNVRSARNEIYDQR